MEVFGISWHVSNLVLSENCEKIFNKIVIRKKGVETTSFLIFSYQIIQNKNVESFPDLWFCLSFLRAPINMWTKATKDYSNFSCDKKNCWVPWKIFRQEWEENFENLRLLIHWETLISHRFYYCTWPLYVPGIDADEILVTNPNSFRPLDVASANNFTGKQADSRNLGYG